MQLVSPKERQMCYPIDKLVSDAEPYDDLNELTQNFDEQSNRTLCGYTSEIIQKMVKKIVADRYNSDANPELTYRESVVKKCKRPSTHTDILHLTEIASYASPDNGKPTKLFWKEVESKTNLTHNEKEGVIIIIQKGLYFISSRLTIWMETHTESAESDDTIFRHFVKLVSYNNSTEDILLENAMTKCDIMTAESQKTSQMEAVFKLEPNDTIYVAYSHPHKLVSDTLKHHFIVYKLPDHTN